MSSPKKSSKQALWAPFFFRTLRWHWEGVQYRWSMGSQDGRFSGISVFHPHFKANKKAYLEGTTHTLISLGDVRYGTNNWWFFHHLQVDSVLGYPSSMLDSHDLLLEVPSSSKQWHQLTPPPPSTDVHDPLGTPEARTISLRPSPWASAFLCFFCKQDPWRIGWFFGGEGTTIEKQKTNLSTSVLEGWFMGSIFLGIELNTVGWWLGNPKQPPVGCIKPCKLWQNLPTSTGDRRISSINSISYFMVLGVQPPTLPKTTSQGLRKWAKSPFLHLPYAPWDWNIYLYMRLKCMEHVVTYSIHGGRFASNSLKWGGALSHVEKQHNWWLWLNKSTGVWSCLVCL